MTNEFIFWFCLSVLFYTYLGYGGVIWCWTRFKRLFSAPPRLESNPSYPSVSLVIAAYNEKSILAQKIENCKALLYPKDLLEIVFVTDGSDDGSESFIRENSDFKVFHSPDRKGKTAALNRVVPQLENEILVFTDANTDLNQESIQRLVQPYSDPNIGAVSGEKRVGGIETDKAHGAGEGLYWKYESALKHMDAEVHTIVGAAGELFSVRRSLFPSVPEDTILDDFMITLGIVARGYRVGYVSDAFALEAPSASLMDEMGRKIRICAGGFQSIVRLPQMLNVFKHPTATFQYVSHRILRWTLAPFLLPILFVSNLIMANGSTFYSSVLGLHIGFYVLAGLGYLTRKKAIRSPWLFTPLYFLMMNLAAYLGLYKYLRGNQHAAWQKVKRAGS